MYVDCYLLMFKLYFSCLICFVTTPTENNPMSLKPKWVFGEMKW